MSAVEMLVDPDAPQQMPYVEFKRVPIQDKAKSLEAGHYVAVDVDFISVTQPGGRDVFEQKVEHFFKQCEKDIFNKRMPNEWLTVYRRKYDAWKNGQELPLEGTPIRGWQIISPAQQETLVRLNILTVESLSKVSADVTQRIGIGGQDLKNKAKAWLKQAKSTGKLAMENAELQKENESLKASVKTLEEKLKELESKFELALANERSSTDK